MEGFKIKLKAQDIDFELEIEKVEDKHIDFVRDIIRMIDKKTTSPLEKIANEELKEKYINAARAYKDISDKIQLENEKSDTDAVKKTNNIDTYVALDVEEELEREEKDKKDKTEELLENPSKNKGITKEEMVTSHKNYFKDTLSTTTDQLINNEKNSEDEKPVESVQYKETEVENKAPLNNNFVNSNSQLVYSTDRSLEYTTRTKDTGNGYITTYQTYYICTNDRCRNTGKYFIAEGQEYITCHNKRCKKKMKVRPATSKGFPHKDSYGNYYVAGKFKSQESFDYWQRPSVVKNFSK